MGHFLFTCSGIFAVSFSSSLRHRQTDKRTDGQTTVSCQCCMAVRSAVNDDKRRSGVTLTTDQWPCVMEQLVCTYTTGSRPQEGTWAPHPRSRWQPSWRNKFKQCNIEGVTFEYKFSYRPRCSNCFGCNWRHFLLLLLLQRLVSTVERQSLARRGWWSQ